jgi:hypothetical protein
MPHAPKTKKDKTKTKKISPAKRNFIILSESGALCSDRQKRDITKVIISISTYIQFLMAAAAKFHQNSQKIRLVLNYARSDVTFIFSKGLRT